MNRDAIILSDDGGESWALAYPAGTDNPFYTLLNSSSDGRYLVCGSLKDVTETVHVSDNYGLTWTERPPAVGGKYLSGYLADNAALMLIGSDGGPIYSSTNFGRNWTALTAAGTAKWNDLAGSRDGSLLIAVSDSILLISQDRGKTWESRAPIEGTACLRAACSKTGSLIVVSVESQSQDQLYLSRDQGKTWTKAEIGTRWRTASISSFAEANTTSLTMPENHGRRQFRKRFSWRLHAYPKTDNSFVPQSNTA